VQERTRSVLVIVGSVFLILGCLCAGLFGAAYYEFTSCVSGLEAPVETTHAAFECPTVHVEVVNLRTTTNWLEGVYHDEALLRVSGGALDEAVDVAVGSQRFRDWIPEVRRPAHRVYGDASAGGFEVFLDPAVVPAAVAGEVEACLIRSYGGVLIDAFRATSAHSYHPDPDLRDGVTYWRSNEEALRPIFTDATGRTIQLQGDGDLWYQEAYSGTRVGQVSRQPDGSLRVNLVLDPDTGPISEPATIQVSDFRNDEGEDIEAWFGVAIVPEFER